MIGQTPSQRPTLTVSALTRLIRDSLEVQFRDLWVEGEISTLRTPASGHVYFTLMDAQSQLRAVLFRSAASRLRFALQEGLSVTARGRLSVYEPRGEYQLVVDSIEPKGIGALQLAFEQLKERLAREGLFDEGRKRELPWFPWTIGVVTSLAGAALHDILSVLRRRCPVVNVIVAPVSVQGEAASGQIAAAIAALGARPEIDVMIVGRGGGAAEDLWAFNDEAVVRAIVQSPVPVVSAVGHEIDVTLADFAADHRAPTPSAAAEAVVPVLDDIVERLGELDSRLQRTMQTRLVLQRRRMDAALQLLRETRFRLQTQAQRIDDLHESLRRMFTERLARLQRRIVDRHHTLLTRGPQQRIRSAGVLLPQLARRLVREARRGVVYRRQSLAGRMAALDALSPLAILQRGYSVLQRVPSGTVLRRAQDVTEGETIRARLADGGLICVVREVFSSRRP